MSIHVQVRIQDFKLGGVLKKLRRAEGGAKIVGVFRVKNHNFTPKNHIFSNFKEVRAGCALCAPPAPDVSPLIVCKLAFIKNIFPRRTFATIGR
jgi:hypothetical protein